MDTASEKESLVKGAKPNAGVVRSGSSEQLQSEESKDQSQLEVISVLLDKDQKYDAQAFDTAHEIDEDWRYNITLGDIEKHRVPSFKNNTDTAAFDELWFACDPESKPRPVRKVFVSGEITRLSDIDADEETFRCRFHLYLHWYITTDEYVDYLQQRKQQTLAEWEPQWFPQLELANSIETSAMEFQNYGSRGRFCLTQFKDWARHLSLAAHHQDVHTNSLLCRAKLKVEGVFSEELELENYPFDCQPLNIIIVEVSAFGRDQDSNVQAAFAPELKKRWFFRFNPRYAVYSGWFMPATKITFGDTGKTSSLAIQMLLKRNWSIYIYRSFLVIAVIDLLGLCGFVILDATDRLNTLLALLLTIVVAMQESLTQSYMTFLGRYSLFGFLFLVLLTVQATFYDHYDAETDSAFLYFFIAFYVVAQIVWVYLAWKARNKERLRLDSDMHRDRNALELARRKTSLTQNLERWTRCGDDDNRHLSFLSEPQFSYRVHHQVEELQKLYRI